MTTQRVRRFCYNSSRAHNSTQIHRDEARLLVTSPAKEVDTLASCGVKVVPCCNESGQERGTSFLEMFLECHLRGEPSLCRTRTHKDSEEACLWAITKKVALSHTFKSRSNPCDWFWTVANHGYGLELKDYYKAGVTFLLRQMISAPETPDSLVTIVLASVL